MENFTKINVMKLALLGFIFVASVITNRLLSTFLLAWVIFYGIYLMGYAYLVYNPLAMDMAKDSKNL